MTCGHGLIHFICCVHGIGSLVLGMPFWAKNVFYAGGRRGVGPPSLPAGGPPRRGPRSGPPRCVPKRRDCVKTRHPREKQRKVPAVQPFPAKKNVVAVNSVR